MPKRNATTTCRPPASRQTRPGIEQYATQRWSGGYLLIAYMKTTASWDRRIERVAFEKMEVGVARPISIAALDDAKQFINRPSAVGSSGQIPGPRTGA